MCVCAVFQLMLLFVLTTQIVLCCSLSTHVGLFYSVLSIWTIFTPFLKSRNIRDFFLVIIFEHGPNASLILHTFGVSFPDFLGGFQLHPKSAPESEKVSPRPPPKNHL